jgi:hypothetical protein
MDMRRQSTAAASAEAIADGPQNQVYTGIITSTSMPLIGNMMMMSSPSTSGSPSARCKQYQAL